MLKGIRLFSLLLFSGFSAFAQPSWFQPRISLLGGYTTDCHSEGSSPNAAFQSRTTGSNFGLSFTNRFHFQNHFFVESGFRYVQYHSSVYDLKFNMDHTLAPVQATLGWGYESISIPVLFGKEYKFRDGIRSMTPYLGMSAGLLMLAEVATGGSGSNTSTMFDVSDNFPQSFYLTFDAGASVTPFHQLPNLSVGLLASVQINNNSFQYSYGGSIFDIQSGATYPFSIYLHPQLFNCSVKLSYQFFKQNNYTHKRHRHKKGNQLSCPE